MTTIRVGAKLANLVDKLADAEKIITPRYLTWLTRYGDDVVYNEDITEWIKYELGRPKPVRSGRFGPSAGGSCKRAQVFSYLGVPTPKTTDPQLQSIYANGTWSHLRTQANLVQAGIITATECDTNMFAPRPNKFPLLRGTIDGMGTVPDDHPRTNWRGLKFGLEFKTANTFLFKHMHTLADPAEKYYAQVARYFHATTLDLFVILIEDKNTQELMEIVVERPTDDGSLLGNMFIDQELEVFDLSASVLSNRLPDRLKPCQLGKGEVFRDCPYGGNMTGPCHQIHDYSDAEWAARPKTSEKRSNKIKIRRTAT